MTKIENGVNVVLFVIHLMSANNVITKYDILMLFLIVMSAIIILNILIKFLSEIISFFLQLNHIMFTMSLIK